MADLMTTHLPHPASVDSLLRARHGDPFSLLGPHQVEGGWAVRAFLPDASRVEVVDATSGLPLGSLSRVHADGLWSGLVASAAPYRLRIATPDGGGGETVREEADPYAFPPLLGELDIYLISEGRHRDLGDVLGAHAMAVDGVQGTRFAVWAPNAQRVSVVGSFNGWDGRRHPMRVRAPSGVWELFVPGVAAGAIYKYELVGPDGALLPWRADPVAWRTELPPATASVVADPTPFAWTDDDWMARRGALQAADAPMSVYELHAMSWMPHDGTPASWQALGDRLIPYIAELGFTHIELMPIMEHPFGGSWGYQVLGQFAPTARMGTPADFAGFVDRCHAAGIGVLLDWVPAHFPTDAHGLAHFDGSPLYEHGNPFEGYHQDWNTFIYNLGRNEVRGFMIAGGLFWLRHFHVDGLRVDAVASMLYRDYSRKEGEWVPNRYGGRENLESIAFLQDLSRAVRETSPGAVLIAEESTSFPNVTRPADEGGLGFDYKWNMGWMHDTLHYIEEQPVYRRWHHGEISFGLVYAFLRAIRAADQPRRGGVRQGLDDREDAGRRLAEVRLAPRLLRLHVDPSRQEAAVHGLRDRAVARMEPRYRARLVAAGRPAAPRRADAAARPQHDLSRRAGAARPRRRPRGLPLGGAARRRQQRVRLAALRPPGAAAAAGGLQLHAGAAARLPRRRAAGRRLAGAAEQRLRALWRLQRRQPRLGRGGGDAIARPAGLARPDPAPAGDADPGTGAVSPTLEASMTRCWPRSVGRPGSRRAGRMRSGGITTSPPPICT